MNNTITDLNIKKEYDTKREQLDASVRFVLHENAAYYNALGTLPQRVQAAVLHMVTDWYKQEGYHWMVLRAGLKQFSRDSGFVTDDEPPFTHEELYY